MTFPFLPKLVRYLLTRETEAAPHVRSIDAATGTKRGRGMGFSGPINPEIAAGARVTRGRTRYLALNHTFLSNGVGNLCAALVGSGARPSVKADDTEIRRLPAAFLRHGQTLRITWGGLIFGVFSGTWHVTLLLMVKPL